MAYGQGAIMHFQKSFPSTLIATAAAMVLSGAPLSAKGHPGFVATESNEAGQNRIFVYHRDGHGRLSLEQVLASGGAGTGSSLGSQGAVALSRNGRFLFAVNAGSNSISSFLVSGEELQLVDTVPSEGLTPVSVTTDGDLLYVLNQGGAGGIMGFRVDREGRLRPLPGSAKPLAHGAADAAEIGISPDGETLVVSEKATQTLDTYRRERGGHFSGPTARASLGPVPYGFAFSGWDDLLVTEAASNSVSSYDLGWSQFETVSASVPSQGAAPCWIASTPDGRMAYATNAHVGTIAGFRVGRKGGLTFVGLTATASVPLLDIASASDFVYALAAGTNQVLGFSVGEDGGLTPINAVSGLPATAQGLAAR
jgi:6-phosphogluconolactonase (cycloisomerase 2 family)